MHHDGNPVTGLGAQALAVHPVIGPATSNADPLHVHVVREAIAGTYTLTASNRPVASPPGLAFR